MSVVQPRPRGTHRTIEWPITTARTCMIPIAHAAQTLRAIAIDRRTRMQCNLPRVSSRSFSGAALRLTTEGTTLSILQYVLMLGPHLTP